MGLTSRNLQSQLVPKECPHYFELALKNGQKRHCGTMKDVERVLSIYPDAVYSKILLPPTPDTVDVMYVEGGKEQVLQAQQILPESQAKPLNL